MKNKIVWSLIYTMAFMYFIFDGNAERPVIITSSIIVFFFFVLWIYQFCK